ncbi:MAG TPA: hypothetical protein VJW73_20450, partial [Gemmatimonadaceae bacterium]|nr:hypothetical protein [Gemmatimonadaceae bacterium]
MRWSQPWRDRWHQANYRGMTAQIIRRAGLVAGLTCCALATARAQFTAADYAQRRAALLAQIPNGVVVALGAHEPVQDYLSFYQSPSF